MEILQWWWVGWWFQVREVEDLHGQVLPSCCPNLDNSGQFFLLWILDRGTEFPRCVLCGWDISQRSIHHGWAGRLFKRSSSRRFVNCVKCSSARVTALLARSLCDERILDQILTTAHR